MGSNQAMVCESALNPPIGRTSVRWKVLATTLAVMIDLRLCLALPLFCDCQTHSKRCHIPSMLAGSCRTLVGKLIANQTSKTCAQALQRIHQSPARLHKAFAGTVDRRRQVQASSAAGTRSAATTSAAASIGAQVRVCV